jgi:hypothetical protein
VPVRSPPNRPTFPEARITKLTSIGLWEFIRDEISLAKKCKVGSINISLDIAGHVADALEARWRESLAREDAKDVDEPRFTQAQMHKGQRRAFMKGWKHARREDVRASGEALTRYPVLPPQSRPDIPRETELL